MSLRTNITLAILALALTGCGFQPLYGKKSNDAESSALLAGVKIDPIPERAGQEMRIDLEDRLNPGGLMPSNPAYRLTVTLKNIITPIGSARDGTVSRYNIYLTSNFVLYRNSDGKKITDGDIGYVDSYNNLTNAYFSTYISEEDAMKRGIEALSELYRQRLAVYLSAATPEIAPAK